MEEKKIKELVAQVVSIAQSRPADTYDDIARWHRDLRDAAANLGVARLEPAFNQVLSERKHDTITQKQKLCSWANEQLRNLGLAARCPETGQPAILHVGPGRHPESGMFQIELLGSRQRTRSSNNLFAIQLTPISERKEPIAELWKHRVSSGRKGRKNQERDTQRD